MVSLTPTGLVGSDHLTRGLRESFSEWTTRTNWESLEKLRDSARAELGDAPVGDSELPWLLSRTVDEDQVFWAIHRACCAAGSRLLDLNTALQFVGRMRELTKMQRTERLEVEVDVQLRAIVIPDVSRDEIVLVATLSSGAPLDEILDFMVAQQLIRLDAREVMRERWLRSDTAIGATEAQRRALEAALAVSFEGTVHEEPRRIYYNCWDHGEMLYRVCDMVLTLHHSIDYTRYPFDWTLLDLRVSGDGNYDVSEKVHRPASSSLCVAGTKMPRGFQLEDVSSQLAPVAVSWAEDGIPSSELRFNLVLRRLASAAVWRSMVPAAVVTAFGVAAVLAALVSGTFRESVMTQVLPAVLIASVALQLTATQHVPAHAGRTVFDCLFALDYCHLFLLLAALELQPAGYHWPLFSLALVTVGLGVSYALMTAGARVRLEPSRREDGTDASIRES